MEFLQRIGLQQHHLITILHYTNVLRTLLTSAFKQTVKTSSYVLDSFKPETYCFFHNQYIAIRANDYNLTSATSPRVAYFFDKESGFYKNGSEFSNSRLNILTAHLYHHNLRVADLSDFFYTTTYESAEGIPQLGYWIAAWQLKNKAFLDISKHFTIHIMTVLGQRYVIDYDPQSEECQEAWITLNSDIRHMNQRNFIGDESESEEEEQVASQNPNPTTTAPTNDSTIVTASTSTVESEKSEGVTPDTQVQPQAETQTTEVQ